MPESTKDTLIGSIQKNASDELRVSLTEYRGRPLCDLRIYSTFTAAKVPMPTKKGLSVRLDHLPDLIRLLSEAQTQAVALGLMSEGNA